MLYKKGKPRFSRFYGCVVVDIFKARDFLYGLVTLWIPYDIVKNHSAVDELVYLLNHPEEKKKRISELHDRIKEKREGKIKVEIGEAQKN